MQTYDLRSLMNNIFNILKTIEAKNAVPKLLTTNPLTNLEVSISIRALITSENKPSVNIVTGRESRLIIGLITAFTRPKTKAAISAEPKLSKWIP